jgi:hypothetical protein
VPLECSNHDIWQSDRAVNLSSGVGDVPRDVAKVGRHRMIRLELPTRGIGKLGFKKVSFPLRPDRLSTV